MSALVAVRRTLESTVAVGMTALVSGSPVSIVSAEDEITSVRVGAPSVVEATETKTEVTSADGAVAATSGTVMLVWSVSAVRVDTAKLLSALSSVTLGIALEPSVAVGVMLVPGSGRAVLIG